MVQQSQINIGFEFDSEFEMKKTNFLAQVLKSVKIDETNIVNFQIE